MPPKRDPDSTPGVKLLRLYRILLLDGRRHFQQDLARMLDCSPQTIIRMIGEIEGVVGSALQTGLDNRRRWYRYEANTRRLFGLAYEEVRYLSVCRDLAVGILPADALQRLDEALRHLALHLADPAQLRGAEGRFAFFAKGSIDYSPHEEHIALLLQAAEQQKVCLVRYRAAGRKEEREHRFLPLRMVAMNNALYMLGGQVDETFAEVVRPCNLAVHRVRDVHVTDRVLPCPLPDGDMATFGLPWHEPREFRIRFSPAVADYIRERRWADRQDLEEREDGGLVLSLVTRSEPELRAWVRSFGEDAVLLSPSPDSSITESAAVEQGAHA